METLKEYTYTQLRKHMYNTANVKINTLLSKEGDNPKLDKSKNIIASTVLHLAPYTLSGYNTCPKASNGCAKACLHTAGNPAYMEGKNNARKAKTLAYFKTKNAFMLMLAKEIHKFYMENKKKGKDTAIRLNGTSDILWELQQVRSLCNKKVLANNLMEMFPDVQFYDYTKIYQRGVYDKQKKQRVLPKNYHLTFSLAEDNDDSARKALQNGLNVAVVFRKILPSFFMEYPVIDGDEYDYRPYDTVKAKGKTCIVGLKAKGKARKDTSGFVR